ncbi:MAG: YdcF family protein [Nevskiales bacterium]
MYLLNRLLEAALLPPLGPVLWIAIGLALSRIRPRLGTAVAWTGVVVALALMTPITVGVLLAPLEATPVFDPARPDGARAIVILGGGMRRFAPDFDGETTNRLTLERVRYGARLARVTGLPVLVSGGVGGAPPSEAKVMQQALAQDFGINARWLEEQSRNTAENARYSAAILKREGIAHIVLVTHAAHMPRARAYFEAAGLKVTPAPTAFLGGPGYGDGFLAWLPSGNCAYAGWYAVHEWAGLLQQRFLPLPAGK